MAADIYEYVSCDMYGNNAQTHPDAKASGPAHEELSAAGNFKFSVPITDPFLSNLEPNVREVQLWRNGVLIWWGPITYQRIDFDAARVDIECDGLLWYLSKRYFGKAGRTNLLFNGSFDDNTLSPWSAVGVTANVVTQWGGRPGATFQCNLYQANANTDTFLRQTITVPGGNVYTISAWFQIRVDATWVGPALDGRGLYAERRTPDGATVEDVQFYAITNDTPRGQFQLATLTLFAPPGRNSQFDIRLYAPGVANSTPIAPRPPGSIIWDDVQVVAMESTSYPYADMGNIINVIVEHSQDSAYLKSTLNITPGCPATGIYLDRTYQHVDHREILDALNEFTQLGLCDIGIYIEPDTYRRILTCYAPQQGAVRTDIALELDAAFNLKKVNQIEKDGRKTVTSAIYQGEGSGPERDESGWWDPSLTNGIVYEGIYQANQGTNHDLLQGLAQATVAALRTPPSIPELLVDGAYIGVINLGDTLPVVVNYGTQQLNANYRVVAMDTDPETDSLTLTVNAA